jgi:surfeit locus 1 family protein
MAVSAAGAPRRANRLLVLFAAVAAVALTARLGAWQWSRAGEKETLQAALDARAALPPVGIDALQMHDRPAESLEFRRVRLRGHWLAQRTVYLDNRQMNARPPLQWEGGALLVQRGWVARDNRERTRLPPLDTPAGEVEISGRIAPPPVRLLEFSAAQTGVIRQNLDPVQYGREIGVALLPISVLQDGATADDGLLRDWPRPALGVHKNLGYAFQWWAMSALITGLYVWHQLLRPRLGSGAR